MTAKYVMEKKEEEKEEKYAALFKGREVEHEDGSWRQSFLCLKSILQTVSMYTLSAVVRNGSALLWGLKASQFSEKRFPMHK